MKVQCPKCGVRLEIPEERLPLGKKVVLQCPKCAERFPVQREPLPTGSEGSESSEVYRKTSLDPELPGYEEGQEYAFVMVDSEELKNGLLGQISQLGYRVHFEDDFDLAVQRLKIYKFKLLVFEEVYKGVPIIDSPVMEFLNQLNMMLRRDMFIVVIGEKLKTLDPMLAYSMSVETVINKKDLPKFYNIVSNAMRQKQTFYKAFIETMQELGKI